MSFNYHHIHAGCSEAVEHMFVHRSRTEGCCGSGRLQADLKCKVRRRFVQENVITELFFLFALKVT